MYRENVTFGFGDLAIGNKGKNDFLNNVQTLIDWKSLELILKKNLNRGFNAVGNPPYSELFSSLQNFNDLFLLLNFIYIFKGSPHNFHCF